VEGAVRAGAGVLAVPVERPVGPVAHFDRVAEMVVSSVALPVVMCRRPGPGGW